MPTCGLCCSRVPETTPGTLVSLELAPPSLACWPPDPISPTGLSSTSIPRLRLWGCCWIWR